jgi:iron complex outermembrane recepter protein
MKTIETAGLKVNTRYVKTIAVLGVIFTMNLMAQAQESTVNAPATTTTEPAKPAEGTPQVERVEVIGSRIKRIAKEGASAVKNVGKESMKNSANTSASDSLRDSTIATYGASREQSGSNAAATATIGLRGLGDTRTLVLLNGHRLPKDPDAQAVDLNLIPQGAIERIEVLKDGASALYGSDALGGVINIVTKKGYIGNEASVKLSAVEKPGGTAYDISMLTGLHGEKYEFLAVLGYTHTDKIFGKDREITKPGLSSISTTAAYQEAGVWNVLPGCPPQYIKTTSTGTRCYYPYNEVATTRPQIGQLNLLTDYEYRLDSGIKIYNRNLVVHKDIEWNYAPVPVQVNVTGPGIAGHPGATTLAYRLGDAGNRDSHDTELNFSALLGVKGNLTSIWEYDISGGYSVINRDNKGVNGYVDGAALDNIIQTTPGGFNPGVTPIGSTVTPVWQNSQSKLLSFDAVFTGELGEMEHGAIGVATGVSAFNEKLEQDADAKSVAGEILGSSGTISNDRRDVQSGFAEVVFPVTEKLELDAAARVDNYSDFGTTVNPKLSAKYNLNSSVMFRASVGTGFKAPTLTELYRASSSGFITFIDRYMCSQDVSYCTANQYEVAGGGNKNLEEEKAFAGSIGTVIQASSNISFSLDAWYTKINNIVGINYEDMTQSELKNGLGSTTSYGVTVDRLPSGEINLVTAPDLNLSNEEIIGIDFNTEIGLVDNFFGHQLFLEDDFSYIVSDKLQGFPGVDARNVVGEWGMPKWRNTTTLSMRNDVSTYALSMRNIPGQNIQDRLIDEKVSDLTEFDISAAYKLSQASSISGGVKNILNSDQPADSFGGTGGVPAVETSLYDYNGRKFFVGYTQKF